MLELFGIGLRNAPNGTVQATINGVDAIVTYVDPQPTYPGLDQINVQIPTSVAGEGLVVVQVTASGIAANPVTITVQ